MKIYIFQPTASIVSTVCHKNFELAAVQYFISNIQISILMVSAGATRSSFGYRLLWGWGFCLGVPCKIESQIGSSGPREANELVNERWCCEVTHVESVVRCDMAHVWGLY